MEAIFLTLVNMSISAGWLILLLLVLRLPLRSAPRWMHCTLWAIAGVRLLLPFRLESVLSLIPSAQTVPGDIALSPSPSISSGVPVLNSVVNPVLSGALSPTVGDSVNPMQLVLFAAARVWLAGMAALLIYALVSWLRLRRDVRPSMHLRGELWLCDSIRSPFILGIFRPRVYLPSDMEGERLDCVIAHERAHLARRDQLWKPLGFAVVALHWYNPLVWLAYILFCRDIELACDERVIRGMDTSGRRVYSEALLSCAMPRRVVAACPLAFGEVGVKQRIRGVLDYRKPAFWVIVAALVICAVVAVCFLTSPRTVGKYSSYAQTGVSLSELSEAECLEFLAEKGVKLPDEIDGMATTGAMAQQAIALAEQTPAQAGAYSYSELLLLSERIRYAVNEYYGTDGSPYYVSDGLGGVVLADGAAGAPFGYSYAVDEIVYSAPQYNFSYSVETAPRYTLTAERRLLMLEEVMALDSQTAGEWTDQGVFAAATLTRSSFDGCFERNGVDYGWVGTDAATLRRSNERTWRLSAADSPNSRFYYLLEQQNGELYLACGYGDPESDGTIRWLFRLSVQPDGD